jgi:hypothetical protein
MRRFWMRTLVLIVAAVVGLAGFGLYVEARIVYDLMPSILSHLGCSLGALMMGGAAIAAARVSE